MASDLFTFMEAVSLEQPNGIGAALLDDVRWHCLTMPSKTFYGQFGMALRQSKIEEGVAAHRVYVWLTANGWTWLRRQQFQQTHQQERNEQYD